MSWREQLCARRHRLICLGWRGRPFREPARALWVGRHVIPLPAFLGTMDLGISQLRETDLNRRPVSYGHTELPNCSTAHRKSTGESDDDH